MTIIDIIVTATEQTAPAKQKRDLLLLVHCANSSKNVAFSLFLLLIVNEWRVTRNHITHYILCHNSDLDHIWIFIQRRKEYVFICP